MNNFVSQELKRIVTCGNKRLGFLYEQIFHFVSLEMFCAFYNYLSARHWGHKQAETSLVVLFFAFCFCGGGGASLQRLHAAVI